MPGCQVGRRYPLLRRGAARDHRVDARVRRLRARRHGSMPAIRRPTVRAVASAWRARRRDHDDAHRGIDWVRELRALRAALRQFALTEPTPTASCTACASDPAAPSVVSTGATTLRRQTRVIGEDGGRGRSRQRRAQVDRQTVVVGSTISTGARALPRMCLRTDRAALTNIASCCRARLPRGLESAAARRTLLVYEQTHTIAGPGGCVQAGLMPDILTIASRARRAGGCIRRLAAVLDRSRPTRGY